MRSITNIVASFLFLLLLSFSYRPNDSVRDDVLKYTNELRKSNKLPALEMNADMNAIAQKHSQDMASGKTNFGHGGFSKRTDEIKKKIKNSAMFAENVAYGVSSGKDAVELWETSEGHKKNMLGDFKYIGIGVATSKSGQIYFTQIFAE